MNCSRHQHQLQQGIGEYQRRRIVSYLLRHSITFTTPEQLRSIHHVTRNVDVHVVIGIHAGANEDEFASWSDGFVAGFQDGHVACCY